MQVSQAITVDYPDLPLSSGLEVIAGLLYIPLSVGGGDFIAFLRKGQPRQVHWAGRPFKSSEVNNTLEPRASFKIWSEIVAGRCRAWSDEHLETAGVLALVYGKVCRAILILVNCLKYHPSSLRCGGRRSLLCRPRSLPIYCSPTPVTKVSVSPDIINALKYNIVSAHSPQSYHQVSAQISGR